MRISASLSPRSPERVSCAAAGRPLHRFSSKIKNRPSALAPARPNKLNSPVENPRSNPTFRRLFPCAAAEICVILSLPLAPDFRLRCAPTLRTGLRSRIRQSCQRYLIFTFIICHQEKVVKTFCDDLRRFVGEDCSCALRGSAELQPFLPNYGASLFPIKLFISKVLEGVLGETF